MKAITEPVQIGKHVITMKLTGDSTAVRSRQRIEQTIALTVANVLLEAGFLLGVNDGEEDTLRFCRDLAKVNAALFTTDEDLLLVYVDADQDDPTNGVVEDTRPDHWVHFVYGNDGWDVISDYCGAASLDPYLGDGTMINRLTDYACEHGTCVGFETPKPKVSARVTKVQAAFDALRSTKGDVSEAKRLTWEQGLRISARTWNKAIQARTIISPTPVLR